MKFYLINLDRSQDRLAWISERLRQLAITPHRVAAVDGKQLSASELEAWERYRHPKFGMGPGELACFLSHRLVWQKVAQGDDRWAFVAEDDVHLSDHTPEFLNSEEWMPSDAEIVKAETVKQRVWLSAQAKGEPFSHRLHTLASYHGGSAAYFVSRDKAIWLLNETERFCSIPDQVLFNPEFHIAKRSRIYQIDPALAVQDWAHDQASGGGTLESLLLAERSKFHGQNQAKSRGNAALVWYKISNPIKKASRVGIAAVANRLGTHLVKKVRFESVNV